jgi:hypothetical protein
MKSTKKVVKKTSKKIVKKHKPIIKKAPNLHLSSGDIFSSKVRDVLGDIICFEFKGVKEDNFIFYSTTYGDNPDAINKIISKFKCNAKIIRSKDSNYCLALYLDFNKINLVLSKIEVENVDVNFDRFNDDVDEE